VVPMLCGGRLAVIGEMKMFVGLAKDRLAGPGGVPCRRPVQPPAHAVPPADHPGVNLLGMMLLSRQLGELSGAISLLFGLDMSITMVDAVKAAIR